MKRIKKWFTCNIWLKVASLVLAVLTWFFLSEFIKS